MRKNKNDDGTLKFQEFIAFLDWWREMSCLINYIIRRGRETRRRVRVSIIKGTQKTNLTICCKCIDAYVIYFKFQVSFDTNRRVDYF